MSWLDNEHSLPVLWERIKKLIKLHADNKENPHGVTKAQVGLGSVDNTADKDKKVAEATKATQDGAGNVITDTYLKKTDSTGFTEALAKKGDTLSYADSTLKLLSGETVLSEVTIEGGAAIDGVSKTITFPDGDTVVETMKDGSKLTTVFGSDGNITATATDADGNVTGTKATTFNSDGSITEEVKEGSTT